jgi:hypothetical protein
VLCFPLPSTSASAPLHAARVSSKLPCVSLPLALPYLDHPTTPPPPSLSSLSPPASQTEQGRKPIVTAPVSPSPHRSRPPLALPTPPEDPPCLPEHLH